VIRPRRPGVRLRIVLGVGATFAFALLVASTFLVSRQRVAMTHDIETTSRLRADDIAAALAGGSLPSSIAIPFEDRSFVPILDAAGEVAASSPNIQGEPAVTTFAPAPSRTAARTVDVLPVGDSPFRVVAVTAGTQTNPLSVYVGSSLEPVDDAVQNLTLALSLGAPSLLALVLGLTWLAVGRALRPVEQIRSEVDSISERNLHRRVPQPPERDEIGRLAATMNHMLDRLDDAAARKRRFLADASHELRSPLATMRSQLEVDLAHPDQADRQATESALLEETLHMQRLVDDLLDLAHLDEQPEPARREVLDIDEVVLAEVRRISTRGKVIVDARQVSAAQTIGDPDSLGRAVRNLLDNAERHAHRTVTVAVAAADGSVRIVVSDDGPGVAAGDRERIFDRFARADSSRSRNDGGRGLGLAIARDIAAAHGGTLRLVDADRGASFAIELPELG
jgi:signal transduction histidine kinase